jgi:uncharacterized membrane protein YciS (DUF1049 family)
MGFIKWLIVFIIAFCIAFIIIITFNQPQFKVPVSALIFTYQTKAFPIWVYVAGALCTGLIIGLFLAAYYFISLKSVIYKQEKRIKELESQLPMSSLNLEQNQQETQDNT